MIDTLPHHKHRWFDPLIVLGITLAVFVPVLTAPFSTLDDYMMLVQNPLFDPPTWEGFKYQLTTPQFHLYSPVSYGILYLIGAVEGGGATMSPVGFKIVSWLTHAGSAFAAWWVIGLLVRNRLSAILGGLIVGLHPLQVEAVAWTTGLKDLLCGGLSFVTIGLYIKHLQTRKNRWWRYAIVAAILAALSKPTAAALPLTIIILDMCLGEGTWEDRLRRLWPFVAVMVVSAAIIVSIQQAQGIARPPLWARPLIAGDSLAFYIGKIVLPIHLSLDYMRTPAAIIESGAIYWTWLIPTVAFGALIMTRSRRAWVACALFIVPILPVSGIVPFDMQQFTTVTDHYVYQSMLGVGLLAGLAIASKRWATVVIVGTLVVLTSLCVMRLMLWQNLKSIFGDSVSKYPRSRLVWQALPAIAMIDSDFAEAERLAKHALTLGDDEIAYDNLASIMQTQGRYAEAAAMARKCLQMHNDLKMPAIRRYISLASKLHDDELARLCAVKWIELEPRNPGAHDFLNMVEASIARKSATQPVDVHP